MNKKSIDIMRCAKNPLLTVADVKPSFEGAVVKGIFNCGAIRHKDEILLLCRVAEAIETSNPNEVSFPIIQEKNGKTEFEKITLIKSEHPELSFEDSRTITKKVGTGKQVVYLTTLSHLRLARSTNGIDFTVDDAPTIYPNAAEECWGMEDPRITYIDDTYYINYTAVSPNGAATSLITTKDFKSFERHGIIFLPENKDVTIFPQKIGDSYYCFNRPVPNAIGTPDMWLSQSKDLLHWGQHKHFYGVAEGWENGRIGGGAPPILTSKGWLKIYHAADAKDRYCLGAFLLDAEQPDKIIAKSQVPLLEPEAPYEVNGFFGKVVFTCGAIMDNGLINIYYGASDDSICLAQITVDEIFSHLGV